MIVAPLLSHVKTLCLYRENGQEITFKLLHGKVVNPSLALHAEEYHYIENTYAKKNEHELPPYRNTKNKYHYKSRI